MGKWSAEAAVHAWQSRQRVDGAVDDENDDDDGDHGDDEDEEDNGEGKEGTRRVERETEREK